MQQHCPLSEDAVTLAITVSRQPYRGQGGNPPNGRFERTMLWEARSGIVIRESVRFETEEETVVQRVISSFPSLST